MSQKQSKEGFLRMVESFASDDFDDENAHSLLYYLVKPNPLSLDKELADMWVKANQLRCDAFKAMMELTKKCKERLEQK